MFKIPCIVKLVGVTFGKAQTNIKTFGNVHIRWFALVREPENPHDRNAIRVALFGEFFMGYIPKETAVHLAPLMDAGRDFDAEYVCVNKHPRHDTLGLTVKIIEAAPTATVGNKLREGESDHGA